MAFAIDIGKRAIQVPDTWNELLEQDPAKVIAAVSAATAHAEDATPADRIWGVAQVVCEVTDAERALIALDYQPAGAEVLGLDPVGDAVEGQQMAADVLRQVADAAAAFAFDIEEEVDDVDDEGDGEVVAVSLRFELTRQPLPRIDLPLPYTHHLVAPAGEGFESLTLRDYVAASFHWSQTMEEGLSPKQRARHIAHVIALLWTPDGDTLGRDDEADLVDALAGMQPAALQAAWFWFASSQRALAQRFPSLFHSAAMSGLPRKKTRTSEYGPLGIIYQLTPDVAKLETVAAQPLYDALDYAAYQVDAAADAADVAERK